MTRPTDPKRRRLTDEEREALRARFDDGATIRSMAKWLGVCTDTAKRVLVREGITDYAGAKFAPSASGLEQTWNRPCSKCGCTKTRPKWSYRCEVCKAREVSGLPDDWLNFMKEPLA